MTGKVPRRRLGISGGRVDMSHGAGGRAMADLIAGIFRDAFANDFLDQGNDQASLPVAYRLYLPQAWAEDADRRAKAGVPDDLRFATKPQIALEQIRAAQADGCSCWVDPPQKCWLKIPQFSATARARGRAPGPGRRRRCPTRPRGRAAATGPR